jgi:VanZ family protein
LLSLKAGCFDLVVLASRSFIKYWLPVLGWMVLVFSASTDVMSAPHTSRFIGPFLRWLVPGISEETVQLAQLTIRKTGHLTEYAVLALLLWRALRQPVPHDPRPWSWRTARHALLLAALYAASDELHQAFVPSRDAAITDVLIDTLGAALGLAFIGILGHLRKRE